MTMLNLHAVIYVIFIYILVNPIRSTAISSIPDVPNESLSGPNAAQEGDLSTVSDSDKVKTFDLTGDEMVNVYAEVLEQDAFFINLDKNVASVDQQANSLDDNFIYDTNVLNPEGSLDSPNFNNIDYSYLLDAKVDSSQNNEQSNKGKGIDDAFYVKPLEPDNYVDTVIISDMQQLSDSNADIPFENKFNFEMFPRDDLKIDQNTPEHNVEKMVIITFYDDTENVKFPKQDPNMGDYMVDETVDEIEREISATKSKISMFVFGWMFMISGIALSCFIVIVGRKNASKRTLKVKKKITSPGEQPYEALGNEV